MSSTLDIKLQKRWFPAPDLSVRITQHSTVDHIHTKHSLATARYQHLDICYIQRAKLKIAFSFQQPS